MLKKVHAVLRAVDHQKKFPPKKVIYKYTRVRKFAYADHKKREDPTKSNVMCINLHEGHLPYLNVISLGF